MQTTENSAKYYSRWIILASCCYMTSMTGTGATFSLISDSLEQIGYATADIALVSVFSNIGQFSGIVGGNILDNYGPGICSKTSGVLFFIGNFFLWLQVKGHIGHTLGSICVSMFIAQLGLSFISQMSVSSALVVFPEEVGPRVISICKAYYAIGGSVLAAMSGAFFDGHAKALVLYIAISMPIVVPLIGSLIVELPNEMISFKFDESKGVNTSLLPNFMHLLGLMTLCFAYIFINLAGSSSAVLQAFAVIILVFSLTVYTIPVFLKKDITAVANISIMGKVIRTGTLEKMGHGVMAGWTRRHFVLTEKCLAYYEDESQQNLKGEFDINLNSKISEAEDDRRLSVGKNYAHRDHCLLLSAHGTGGEELLISAGSEAERAEWKDAINTVISARVEVAPTVQETGSFAEKLFFSDSSLERATAESYRRPRKFVRDSSVRSLNQSTNSDGIVLTEKQALHSGPNSSSTEEKKAPSKDLSTLKMIQTVRFWAAFFVQACGMGGTLIVINLLKQIGEAYDIGDVTVYVAILNLSSALARGSFGFVSRYLEPYFTYCGMMGLCNAVVFFTNLTFAYTGGHPALFMFLVIVTGACYGAVNTIMTAVNVDMFGKEYLSTNDGMFDVASSAGSFAFVFGLTAVFPVDDSDKTDEDDGLGCSGPHCFQNIFITSACLCLFAFIVSLFLNYWLFKMRREFPGQY